MSEHAGAPAPATSSATSPLRGLLLPGAIATTLIAGFYLPAHPNPSVGQTVLALIAAVYVLAMSVVLQRVTRTLIVGGWRSVADAALAHPRGVADGAPPVRRLAGVAAAAAVSAVLAAVAAAATAGTAPPSYQHAIGSLALLANLGLLLTALVPMPGLAAWDAATALAELRCPEASHRTAHTAGTAKGAAGVVAVGLALLSLAAGDVMLAALGAVLAASAWSQAETARRLDAAARFLACHTAADLARPVSAVRRVDERVADFPLSAFDESALVIDGAALFVGAIGPSQLREAVRRPAATCGDLMVPASVLRIVVGSTPANEIASDLETSGIVLVRGDGRYYAVGVEDTVARLRAWDASEADAFEAVHRARP